MCASTLYVVVVFFHSVFKYKMFSEFQLKFKILSFPIKKYVSLWIIQKQKQRKHFYTRHLVHIIYLSRFYSIVIIVSILNEIESRLNSLFFSLKIIESAALRVFVIIVVRLHNSYSHTFTISRPFTIHFVFVFSFSFISRWKRWNIGQWWIP